MHQTSAPLNTKPRSSGTRPGMLASLALAVMILGLVLWYLLPRPTDGGAGSEGTYPLPSAVPSIVASSS
jgi:hypothetical protein